MIKYFAVMKKHGIWKNMGEKLSYESKGSTGIAGGFGSWANPSVVPHRGRFTNPCLVAQLDVLSILAFGRIAQWSAHQLQLCWRSIPWTRIVCPSTSSEILEPPWTVELLLDPLLFLWHRCFCPELAVTKLMTVFGNLLLAFQQACLLPHLLHDLI